MREMRQKRKGVAKYQRKRYAIQQKLYGKSKETQEEQELASELFKNKIFHDNLVTERQNESKFHGFIAAFCAMTNRPAPALMNLRNTPSVLKNCNPTITEDPSESAVTCELDNAQINEENVMNKQEEAELESGNASD